MNDDERLTRFIKDIEQIVGRVKAAESPYVQGSQTYEEDLVVRARVSSRTKRPSVREPGTNRNHTPIGQEHNDGYSANSQ